jgi:hypothetical protein
LTALVSVRRRAKHAASPFLGVAQDGSRATFFLADEADEADEAGGATAWAGICMPRTVIAAALNRVRQAAALRRKTEPVLGEVRKRLLLGSPCWVDSYVVPGRQRMRAVHIRRNQLAYLEAQLTIDRVLHVHFMLLFHAKRDLSLSRK